MAAPSDADVQTPSIFRTLLPTLGAKTSDVTKLFKIRICRMRISTSKIRRIRMRMSLDKGLFYIGMQHTGLCQLNGCNNMLFSNVNIISVQIITM